MPLLPPLPRLPALLAALAAAAAQWTPLPNLRCHGDLSQTHGVATLAACEALCDAAGPPCVAVSLCPPAGAADCSAGAPGGPQPGTCWLYPPAALPCSAQQAQGWQSAVKPAPPPAPTPTPPPDWAARVEAGHMVYSGYPPALIGEGFFPVLGNGFLAMEAGPFTQAFENAWPWRDAGSLKLSGVYNGRNYSSPSHRAQLPRLADCALLPVPGGELMPLGTAMDFELGAFYNRTLVGRGVPGCPQGTTIEQRTYAHHALRELLVHELSASSADPAWPGCTLGVAWAPSPASPDAALTASAAGAAAVFSGSTLLAEEAGLPLRAVAVAMPAWLAAGPRSLTFTPAAPRVTACAVLRSDLDVAPGASAPQVAQAALALWQDYAQRGSEALWDSHAGAVRALWASGGVEVAGNASLAQTLNASLYDIVVASLREDWNWSTSPGGLATGGYSGHTFWDMETWMHPVLTVLFPSLARAATQYRLDRVPASQANARSLNESGTHFAWESAASGLWASPWRAADYSEIHLQADIALAVRKLYYATGDLALLQRAWPLLNGTCSFWECRLTRSDTPRNASAPPGYPAGCASKAGAGNFTARGVITPDESSGVVDDSAYTNAAAAEALAWCGEAAAALGMPAASLPPLWAAAAAAPYLPLSLTLDASGPVHAQNAGYAGKTINQADVALLQYPLGLKMERGLAQRDLDYYAARTDFAGMYTGDAAYSCAYLALGNRSMADKQLSYTFGHLSSEFRVFTETEITGSGAPPATTGTQHFITGSGGLAQIFVFGYPGLRIERLGALSFTAAAPLLPPLGVTALRLRGLHLLGTAFDVTYNASDFCAGLQGSGGGGGAALDLVVVASGQRLALPGAGAQVCVPVQAVEVVGVGYA